MTNEDHASTDKELLECALIEEMEQIQAYMDKIKENARVQAKATDRR